MSKCDICGDQSYMVVYEDREKEHIKELLCSNCFMEDEREKNLIGEFIEDTYTNVEVLHDQN